MANRFQNFTLNLLLPPSKRSLDQTNRRNVVMLPAMGCADGYIRPSLSACVWRAALATPAAYGGKAVAAVGNGTAPELIGRDANKPSAARGAS